MGWEKLDEKIQKSDGYRLFRKYRKLITFIEGIFIIGLLIGINMYFYQDWQIKKQINEKCGYSDSNWECVCTPEAVNAYRGEQIEIILDPKKNLNTQGVQDGELVG